MKIESGRGVAPSSSAKRSEAGAATGFAVQAESAPRATAASGVMSVPVLDAVLALQAEGSPGEKRARQIRRGRDALDALEELARGLMLGGTGSELKSRLENLRRGAEDTGQPELDGVLREIDIRLAVEAAKLEMSVAAA